MSTSEPPVSGEVDVTAATLDPVTARLQRRVRVALIEILAAATPVGWEVVGSSTWATLPLDVVVRPSSGPDEQSSLPVLCVDITAGGGSRRP